MDNLENVSPVVQRMCETMDEDGRWTVEYDTPSSFTMTDTHLNITFNLDYSSGGWWEVSGLNKEESALIGSKSLNIRHNQHKSLREKKLSALEQHYKP